MESHLVTIREFIPTVTNADSVPVEKSDFWPGSYFCYKIARDDSPYAQEVCLYIDNRPIVDPLFDASEVSLMEGVEFATGKTPVGYFLPGGRLMTMAPTTKLAYISCDSKYNDRYACLYLLG